jgi:pentapeptide MXKDX repeat protein
MKTRLLFAAAIAAGLAVAPAAFAEDAMSKPGMAKDTKMDSKMDKKTDAMSKEPDKMQKSGTMMMDKKDSMSKDGIKK